MCHPSPSQALQWPYRFQNTRLLEEALTPPSAGLPHNNQRLELLGDALLQGAITLLLMRLKPQWQEGQLSKLRSQLVNTDSLREWAQSLGVSLLKGPRSPRKPSPQGIQKPLADAMEALLAAVYLDAEAAGCSGFAAVCHLVEDHFQAAVTAADPSTWETRDAKTTLQERAAAQGFPPPTYALLSRTGPDHQPVFRVRLTLGAHHIDAEGPTLKRAQTEAARKLLTQL